MILPTVLAALLPLALQEPTPPAAVGVAHLRSVPVGAAPHGIRFSKDGALAFVALSGDGEIAVLDCETLEIVEKIPAGKAPLDLIPLGDGGEWVATQFSGRELVGVGEASSARWEVAPGPSLFAPRLVDGLAWVTCERGDTLIGFDTTTGELRSHHVTGPRPYPADVTRDGVLAFVPSREDGSVAVIDLLNGGTAATVEVGTAPEGGALTTDDTSYIVACGGDDALAWINTASYEVVARLTEGVGPRPFSVATSLDGRLALVNNAGGSTVSVIDLAARSAVGEVEVGEQPIVIRMHPDGRRAFVSCEVSGTVAVLALPEPRRARPRNPKRSEVLVLGTIHGGHETSETYDLPLLEQIVRAVDPDYVLAEIPPNRAEAAMEGFRRDGVVTEPRVARFPEYVRVVYPLTRELHFEIVPTAGWTEPMARYRRERLQAISEDPDRAEDWAAYEEAGRRSAECLRAAGAEDDPHFIHTAAYDDCVELELAVYDRLFDDELGPGGWTAINRAHYAGIARALDLHRGEGKRFLVTYGAGHKGWLLRALRQRSDVELLEAEPFLDRAEAALGR